MVAPMMSLAAEVAQVYYRIATDDAATAGGLEDAGGSWPAAHWATWVCA